MMENMHGDEVVLMVKKKMIVEKKLNSGDD
jgi:hypothetical protein